MPESPLKTADWLPTGLSRSCHAISQGGIAKDPQNLSRPYLRQRDLWIRLSVREHQLDFMNNCSFQTHPFWDKVIVNCISTNWNYPGKPKRQGWKDSQRFEAYGVEITEVRSRMAIDFMITLKCGTYFALQFRMYMLITTKVVDDSCKCGGSGLAPGDSVTVLDDVLAKTRTWASYTKSEACAAS